MSELRGSPAQSDAANTSKESGEYIDMEFLDMIWTKDSSLLLHAIHSLSYWRISQKIILYSGFKTPYIKFRGTTKIESIHE
jgi:hypothetical protein